MNVLIVNGHPRTGSFSEALVHAYETGAKEAGVTSKTLVLADLSFNPDVTHFSPNQQFLELCIEEAQQLISWAHHVVFVYPTWWGTMPALLKGFIDRTFTAGFAFEDIEGGTGYAPLLRGRTAQIITTMDTPLWVYRWINHSPGNNAMRKATLQFCGFNMAKTLSFGPLKSSTFKQREQWLIRVGNEGQSLRNGALTPWSKFKIKAGNWLKALRLQFYPMTCVAYATGAFAAENMGYGYSRSIFWVGYLWLFFLEVTTVLTNDYFDFKSDQQNKYFGPFTGGSRVIVEKLLSFGEIKRGILTGLLLSFLSFGAMLFLARGDTSSIVLTCGILFVLALGYTVPPLRLSYRSLGEVTVGVTHSFAVIVCGYIFQGGNILDTVPWLLSLPLFFAVLPSIIMAGIPDYDADKAASKNTLAVRFGKKRAALLAMIFTIVAALIVIGFRILNVLPEAFSSLIYFVIPHALLLMVLITRYIKLPSPSPRINHLLIAALTYLVWFALVPLINL